MKVSKTLARPENWQDFEKLCKKLWGEIWKCPEILRNGRIGQEQNGVDVYGIPTNESKYFGIQCKGKDEYTHKQLTKKEVDEEVKKALKFEPKLKKFYFATTAVKDNKIEKLIRQKNIEHKKKGLFEVHIFSWEDIVDLIEENQATYNYYVNSINFKASSSVELAFQNNSNVLTINPKFEREYIFYRKKEEIPDFSNPFLDKIQQQATLATILSINRHDKTQINHSFSPIILRVNNTGDIAIEEIKVEIQLSGEVQEIAESNIIKPKFSLIVDTPRISNTYIYNDTKFIKIVPREKVLVSEDSFKSDDIFLKPKPKESIIILKWKLISKSFKQSGELTINVVPDFETRYDFEVVDDEADVREEIREIKDLIKDKQE